jgi:ribosomal protein L11 methyltransferase
VIEGPATTATMTHYLELRCRWPAGQEEALSCALAAVPILGAEIGGERAGLVDVTVFVDRDLEAEVGLLDELLRRSGARDVEISSLVERDWLAEYRDAVTAFAVGRRWWIDPHPEAPTPAPAGRFRLVVEPRSAFGSGSHESTQLALCFVEDIPVDGLGVLDVGTGSGVLAVAAAARGARPVVGFDLDPRAAFIARHTLGQQDGALEVAIFAGGIDAVAANRFEVLLCNMVSSRFLPLLGRIRAVLVPAGRLVLAGFLAVEEGPVRAALESCGFHIDGAKRLGEWSAVTAARSGQ